MKLLLGVPITNAQYQKIRRASKRNGVSVGEYLVLGGLFNAEQGFVAYPKRKRSKS